MHGSVRAQLRVKNSYKIRREVQSSATAGARLDERCTAVPLQVKGSHKRKLEVHGSVRAQLRVKNSYKIRREVHNSATAGARQ